MTDYLQQLLASVLGAENRDATARELLPRVDELGLVESERHLLIGVLMHGLGDETAATLHLGGLLTSEDVQLRAIAFALTRSFQVRPLISDGSRLRSIQYQTAIEPVIDQTISSLKVAVQFGAPELAQALLGVAYVAVCEWRCATSRLTSLGGPNGVLIEALMAVLEVLANSGTPIADLTVRLAENVRSEPTFSKENRMILDSLLPRVTGQAPEHPV